MRLCTLGLLATLLATPTLLAQPAPESAAEQAPSWLNDEAGALSDAGRARVTSLADEAWSRGQVRLAVTLVRDTGAATVAERARSAGARRGSAGARCCCTSPSTVAPTTSRAGRRAGVAVL
ncbi:MAG: TPM domain-containing protein [Polyangiales bacterium]